MFFLGAPSDQEFVELDRLSVTLQLDDLLIDIDLFKLGLQDRNLSLRKEVLFDVVHLVLAEGGEFLP